jgi:hypothetical protein
MPVTLTIQNSINFTKPYLKNQPADVTGMEPALTAANLILQFLLSAPFKWRFNRRKFTFQTIATPPTPDYTVSLPDFGFMENQWLTDSKGMIHSMNGALSLPVDANTSRPTVIAPQYDDNVGNILFRLKNTPDAVYSIFGDYQAKPRWIYSFAETWGTVPDDFSFCYNLGFLTMLSLLVNDNRFPIYERWFLSKILGVQDGLDDQARDIFITAWMNLTRTVGRAQGATQQGVAARGT